MNLLIKKIVRITDNENTFTITIILYYILMSLCCHTFCNSRKIEPKCCIGGKKLNQGIITPTKHRGCLQIEYVHIGF